MRHTGIRADFAPRAHARPRVMSRRSHTEEERRCRTPRSSSRRGGERARSQNEWPRYLDGADAACTVLACASVEDGAGSRARRAPPSGPGGKPRRTRRSTGQPYGERRGVERSVTRPRRTRRAAVGPGSTRGRPR
jgi:hypothetical protein